MKRFILMAIFISLYCVNKDAAAQTQFNISNRTTGDTLVTVDDQGRVGIGTTAPSVDLEVKSDAPENRAIISVGNSDDTNFLFMYGGRGGGSPLSPGLYWGASVPLRFVGYDGGYTEWMRLTEFGSLGIGTTSPTQMLEVTDTIYSTLGGFMFPDGSVQESAAGAGGTAGNTLDEAYDQGGDGSGRTIVADAGALEVGGTDGAVFSGTYESGSIPVSGAGTRLMWYPGRAAFRAGRVFGSQWDDANIGNYSMALGNMTMASGEYSTALGWSNTASGFASTAFGRSTTASGYNATAFGLSSVASGSYSTTFGGQTTASGPYTFAIGQEIEASGSHSVAIALSDQNGLQVAQDSTMAVMGGNVGIGTVTPSTRLEVADTIYSSFGGFRFPDGSVQSSAAGGGGTAGNTLDGAYDQGGNGNGRTIVADAGALEVGGVDGVLFTGTMGSGSIPTEADGTRFMWYPGKAALRAGHSVGTAWDDSTIGDYSFGFGRNANARGVYSAAFGVGTEANGHGSFVTGNQSEATGNNAFAAGYLARAEGDYSVALGQYTHASGTHAFAMGYYTDAEGYSSTALGTETVASGSYSIATGYNSEASGTASTAMGDQTEASGSYSTAVGSDIRVTGNYSVGIGLWNPITTPVISQMATMAIMGGKVGIEETAPITQLEVGGRDGVMFTGSPPFGTILNEGAGTRMMWYPRKSAFRSGTVTGTEWDDANIGEYSAALGYNTIASGDEGTVAMGYNTVVRGNGALAAGFSNVVNGSYSVAAGRFCTADEAYATAWGSMAKAHHRASMVFAANIATGIDDSVYTGGDEQIVFRADGGLYFTNTGGAAPYNASRFIDTYTGAYLSTGGAWTNASSRDFKENIADLSLQQALEAVRELHPVTYNYKSEQYENYVGFIAEDVPEIAATKDRKGLSTMDIVALLTKVVQNQQEVLQNQQSELKRLKAIIEGLEQ